LPEAIKAPEIISIEALMSLAFIDLVKFLFSYLKAEAAVDLD